MTDIYSSAKWEGKALDPGNIHDVNTQPIVED